MPRAETVEGVEARGGGWWVYTSVMEPTYNDKLWLTMKPPPNLPHFKNRNGGGKMNEYSCMSFGDAYFAHPDEARGGSRRGTHL